MPKQLSLSERIVIERMLHQDYTFAAIGRALERSASTIAREVLNYRCYAERVQTISDNDCIHFGSCLKVRICPDASRHECVGYHCKRCPDEVMCTQICEKYESSCCPLLDRPPYVCSGCQKQFGCRKNHAYYTANRADVAHHKAIRLAHSGIHKTTAELHRIEKLITPLIEKGQSLNHICSTHAEELGISERTLYNYIDWKVFSVRNIDLPQKVVYRKRRRPKILVKYEYRCRCGRSYEDFKAYTEAHPELPIVEMDTVKGSREKGKVFLTMIFRKSSFMLIFLMKDGTQKSVLNVFDSLCSAIGVAAFKRLFPIILTDNGVEFKAPEELEYTRTGIPRTKVFYCDPQASWQKPQIENNHRLIRRILKKGTSFNKLTIADVTLITRHINSVCRDQFENRTPFDLMTGADEKKLLSSLHLEPVPPDEVTLKPTLITH